MSNRKKTSSSAYRATVDLVFCGSKTCDMLSGRIGCGGRYLGHQKAHRQGNGLPTLPEGRPEEVKNNGPGLGVILPSAAAFSASSGQGEWGRIRGRGKSRCGHPSGVGHMIQASSRDPVLSHSAVPEGWRFAAGYSVAVLSADSPLPPCSAVQAVGAGLGSHPPYSCRHPPNTQVVPSSCHWHSAGFRDNKPAGADEADWRRGPVSGIGPGRRASHPESVPDFARHCNRREGDHRLQDQAAEQRR